MYVNLEDYVSITAGVPNTKFLEVIDLFVTKCNARLHWGKSGWDKSTGCANCCFDGAAEYGTDWCHFGCAVNSLDPTGKFSGISQVWQWAASLGGAPVPFPSCCTPDGFSASCKCDSVRPAGCPA